jgi:hypothetical protein
MKKLKILITTFLEKHFKIRVESNVLWMEVPTICSTRRDKDDIIMSAIEHLEQTIKIK